MRVNCWPRARTSSPSDRRLTDIIRNNSERVSTIINNVLQLSRRESTKPTRLTLGDWLEDFLAEFSQDHASADRRDRRARGVGRSRGALRPEPSASGGLESLRQRDQVRRATRRHQGRNQLGRLTPSYRPYLEVADRGTGIEPQASDRIFEPFFTGRKGGTGLGLFIARELCQLNRAILLYEPRAGGGSVFRVVFSDPQRWEE